MVKPRFKNDTFSTLHRLLESSRKTTQKSKLENQRLLTSNLCMFFIDTKSRLTYIAKSLESKVELLKSLDEKVVAKINIDAIEADIVQSDEIELKTKLTIHIINQLLLNKEHQESNVSARGTPRPDREGEGVTGLATPGIPEPRQLLASSSPSRSIRTGVRPKLQKMNLQRCNGDVTKFTSFWETFESTFHSNEGISDIDKFNYLQTLLEGPAAKAIQCLPMVEANYESAVEMLKERYGNKQKIISSHMDASLKHQNVVFS